MKKVIITEEGQGKGSRWKKVTLNKRKICGKSQEPEFMTSSNREVVIELHGGYWKISYFGFTRSPEEFNTLFLSEGEAKKFLDAWLKRTQKRPYRAYGKRMTSA